MRSGITRRWLRGNLLITVLLVLLAEVMFLHSYTRSYYNSVQQTMYRRFSSVTGQLKVYTADTVYSAAANRSMALRRMVEQYSDKDKYEFMLLDSYGGVIASSSGTDADGIVNNLDFVQAQDAADGLGMAVYRTESGEVVMAACYLVPYAAEDVAALPPLPRALVASQTTLPMERWQALLPALRAKISQPDFYCSICAATRVRQQAARELAIACDRMIVVGGRQSANTRKLYEACLALCPQTIWVERAADIPPRFADIHAHHIGIAAGASTPDWSFKEVVTAMNDIENKVLETEPAANEAAKTIDENDFMASIEASMRRIHTGQTVTGTVVQVTDDEVCVNIGYKSDGLIKRSDLVDQDVKIGDEIEVEVVKVNDGEGNVILSQRNIINKKAWDALMAKYEAGEYVEGVGKEAVKGGLICMVDGVRAFVPASRLSKRYVEKIDQFVGQTMKLKIIDVDAAKKRIVCSRKDVILEEEAAKKAAAWEKIEEGAILHGIVRRFADFGAFVDLGGVDGLIHITDLAWHRVGHPSEVLSINQEVEVKVLSVDRERERIQLGYKQLQAKPWDNIEEKYPVGLILERKVVRIRPFGAFVELEPGVDGLVHISQVALTRVNKVEDVLSVGQDVTVKVLGVDPAAHRISLSIREALEDKAFDYGEGIPEEEYPVDEQPAETQE